MRKVITITISVFAVIVGIMIYMKCTEKQRKLRFKNIDTNIEDSYLDISYGTDSADLTVYMFVNYKCKLCRQFLILNLPYIQQKYIDSGYVRFVIKPIEIAEDKDMMTAIQLLLCMNQNNDADEINELLISEPRAVYSDDFRQLVSDIENGNPNLAECLLSDDYEYIRQNNLLFNKIGSKGTPIFVISKHLYKGYRDINNFCKIIDYELNN